MSNNLIRVIRELKNEGVAVPSLRPKHTSDYIVQDSFAHQVSDETRNREQYPIFPRSEHVKEVEVQSGSLGRPARPLFLSDLSPVLCLKAGVMSTQTWKKTRDYLL